jgi:Amt family ammonium transporter
MSAQSTGGVSGLVAINSLMAMVGGIIAAALVGKADPGFVHNGALAGLVAVCAGSDVMHPIGALAVGGIAGAIFVSALTGRRRSSRSTTCSASGRCTGCAGCGAASPAGIFGLEALGGMGGVSPCGAAARLARAVGLCLCRRVRALLS